MQSFYSRGPGPMETSVKMKQQKEVKINGWAAHLTTGVSVTLALLTLGLIALIWIAAASESRRMLEKIEISVVMADRVGDDRAMAVCEAIRNQPFALDVRYISKFQALANWKEATGEDLEHVFGVNPLSPEIAFTLKGDWTSVSKIDAVKRGIAVIDGVEEVGVPDSQLIEAMNENIRKLTIGFAVVVVIMFIISFVLISNTVRLSIYSKRFTIHTMQLVGATDGFIRRPFISSNALVGALAGLISAAVLSTLLAFSPKMGFEELSVLIPWEWMLLVDVALIVIGAAICSVAAALATTRHLRQDYEDLFK